MEYLHWIFSFLLFLRSIASRLYKMAILMNHQSAVSHQWLPYSVTRPYRIRLSENPRQNLEESLTPQAQLSIQWTFFPFGLKWIPLLRRHVLIAIKTFSPKVKTINSSLIKNIYIFDISYHFLQSEQNKSEVWKGKNLCAWGVNILLRILIFDTWSRNCALYRFIQYRLYYINYII